MADCIADVGDLAFHIRNAGLDLRQFKDNLISNYRLARGLTAFMARSGGRNISEH